MKIAIISDLHFGVRSDAEVFRNMQRRFYEDQFFPYVEKHGIDTVFDLGDTFDRRKFINFKTLAFAREVLFDRMKQDNIKLFMLIGNHDTYLKNNNSINSPRLLLSDYDNITMYQHLPMETSFGGAKVLMTPWIAPEKEAECMDIISRSDADVLFGHLELSGFPLHGPEQIAYDGMSVKPFRKFEKVYSGHYHHPSHNGNIRYLGCPYELTWADYGKPRGFHIFDTETLEVEFIRNKVDMFHVLTYDDECDTIEELMEKITPELKDTYVKVVIINKETPSTFDIFIEELEKTGVADLKVVEDHRNQDTLKEEDLLDEAEDTVSIMRKYVDGMNTNQDKDNLKKVMFDLYNDALNV